jgi:uncharacterized damage-inducible protein DinB
MKGQAMPALDITPNWGRLNETIVNLVDYIPDDKLDWAPSPELFNFRGILLHISISRQNWLGGLVKDGEGSADFFGVPNPKERLVEHLRNSWQRVERFLSKPENLSRVYTGDGENFESRAVDGNWIAFHLLEHDAHHRSDLFHYLHILGVEHPEVETP